MAQFRKKPVVVEARKFEAGQFDRVKKFCGGMFEVDRGRIVGLIVPTLEGDMRANVGDWIIRGVHGEYYPCKPDIFVETYEPADSPRFDPATVKRCADICRRPGWRFAPGMIDIKEGSKEPLTGISHGEMFAFINLVLAIRADEIEREADNE